MNTNVPFRARANHQAALPSTLFTFAPHKVKSYTPTTSPTPLPHPTNWSSNSYLPCNNIGVDGSYNQALYHLHAGTGTDNVNPVYDAQPAGANWQRASGADNTSFPNDGQGEKWQGAAADLLAVQTFAESGTVDKGQCHKYGMKPVAARRTAHGCFGFLSNDSLASPNRCLAPDQTKYRACSYDAHWKVVQPNAPSTPYDNSIYDTTGIMLRSVNATSGVITSNVVITDTTTGTPVIVTSTSNPVANDFSFLFGVVNPDIPSIAGFLTGLVGGAITAQYHIQDVGGYGDGGFSIVMVATSPRVREYHHTNADGSTMDIVITTTNTFYQWSVQWTLVGARGSAIGTNATFDYHGSMELSAAQTYADVQTDLESLASNWLLNDDKLYPYRRDGWHGIMPLVQRREVATAVSPLGWNVPLVDDLTTGFTSPYTQRDWFDPNGQAFYWTTGGPGTHAAAGLRTLLDGAIIGAPMAQVISGTPTVVPGGSGWFDFYYSDWRWCLGASSDWHQYAYAFGGNLADCKVSVCDPNYYNAGPTFDTLLPSAATHWTGNIDVHLYPRGAVIDQQPAVNGKEQPITLVKWGETRLPVPSYNFARPCGFDRVLIDEYTAKCFTSGLTMESPLPETPTALVAQTLLIWGPPGSDSNNGIYTGCTQSGSVLTLGTLISALPTDYYHPFCGLGGETTENRFPHGFVGIVRFPNAWALCGCQPFTCSDHGSGKTKLTFKKPQTNLRAGDALDLSDKNRIPWLTNITIDSRIDDLNFIANVSYASVVAHNLIWATSHGAPAYYFNDSSQKFDLRFGAWTNLPRYPRWSAGAAHNAGDIILDSNGNYQTAALTAASGTTEPTWATTTGVTTNDTGTIQIWTCTESFAGCNAARLSMSGCQPQVVAFSPNNEVWPTQTTPDGTETTGITAWFGSTPLPGFVADGVFGSSVQANVEFDIPDLLWQTPKTPCAQPSNVYIIHEDDGSCQPDTSTVDDYGNVTWQLYYAPRPRMEALRLPPDGTGGNGWGAARDEAAPALPVDAVNGAMTWPAMAKPTAPGDLTLFTFSPALEPWMRYANESKHCHDKTAPCRFVKSYYACTGV